MTFIIAECGVNWRDLVDADEMIREAAKAGADAVKWQCYQPDFLPAVKDSKTGKIIYGHPRAEELNRIALDEPTIRYLYWRCQQHGIEFMCTPFYSEAVAMLDPYVMRWKIRYADRKNESILAPCRATGKPMLISGKNVFCISEYPPDNKEYIVPDDCIGFSSHYPMVGPFLHNFGYTEVHVRLDRYEPHYCPIDTAVSITMSELAELCRRVKG